MGLAARLLRKLGDMYGLLRYGPTRLADLDGRLHALEASHASATADLRREAGWLRDRLAALEIALDRVDARTAPAADAAMPASQAAAQEAFYPALEQQFRGTRDDLRGRLAVYRPWIEAAPAGTVADLGCGRGEWLELLREWGRDAVGVDANAVLAAQNRARGLDAVSGDAVGWLEAQPPGSLAAITSFHVVEHLPFGVLLALVERARRALMPGGLLILETPNPENLLVASHTFWIDPTHQRPLPPALLAFVVTHAGLSVEATPRLHPPEPSGDTPADPVLQQLLMQGRDYAVVARKPIA